MSLNALPRRFSLVNLLVSIVFASCLPAESAGADAQKLIPLYFGVNACRRCHSEGDKQEPVLCRCTEIEAWEKGDKHKDAYIVLLGDRAKRMGELLQIEVAKDKRCVSCHGVYVTDAKLKHASFRQEDGVSCVACHGAYKNWIDPHGGIDKENWRTYSREKKQNEFGMTDLWNPVQRTALCASCHIGNAGEGKIVSHAMYAAGHPPLPSLEVATFSDQMPRHWEYQREKKPEVRKLFDYDAEKARFEQTQLVVVSGVVALRESMRLLTAQAPDRSWPELASFDCYACHHDLKNPSWRQQRGYAGKPGRPALRSWPMTLVKIGMLQAGEDYRQMPSPLAALQHSLAARPFGKAQEVSASAQKVIDWANQVLKKLPQRYEPSDVEKLLRGLTSLQSHELPDYDSARQIAWAIRIIYHELAHAPGAPIRNHDKIDALLAALDKELKLKLPSGKESILGHLQEGLEKVYEYDPVLFRQRMEELAKLLPS